MNLFSLLYRAVNILNYEGRMFIFVRPGGHFGDIVVQHVSQRNQGISFISVDDDAKDSAADDHPGPEEVLEGNFAREGTFHSKFFEIVF